jgi:hypothetical protein
VRQPGGWPAHRADARPHAPTPCTLGVFLTGSLTYRQAGKQ